MVNRNPYVDAGISRGGLYQPPAPVQKIIINDSTTGYVINAQLLGFQVVVAGNNDNRVYILVQNNTGVSIALGVGSPNAQGLVIASGGYYERQFYCFTQQVYVTLLGASVAGNYITVEEGSTQAA